MEESRLRQLKRFLRVYAELSLALFSGLMIAFMLKTPFLSNATFLDFTVWANVAHGISMVPHA